MLTGITFDTIKIVVSNIHDDNNISPLLICMPFPKHFYIYYFIYMCMTIFHNSQANPVKSAEQKSNTILKWGIWGKQMLRGFSVSTDLWDQDQSTATHKSLSPVLQDSCSLSRWQGLHLGNFKDESLTRSAPKPRELHWVSFLTNKIHIWISSLVSK